MALTILQENFVRALLADPTRNGTSAAIRAGYSEKRAKQLANCSPIPKYSSRSPKNKLLPSTMPKRMPTM